MDQDAALHRYELRCSQCGAMETYSFNEIYERLREKGFLRRQDRPTAELLQEMVRACVRDGLWERCSQCGTGRPSPSLAAKPELEADPSWGDTVYCEVCRAAIPPERLELFPDSRRCVKCQGKVEKGGSVSEAEYCPHCGDILQLKLVARGVSAYRSYCPSCRKTF